MLSATPRYSKIFDVITSTLYILVMTAGSRGKCVNCLAPRRDDVGDLQVTTDEDLR